MTTNAKIKSDWQQAGVGELVVLYELDTTDLGGSIFRFVEGTISGVAVDFQGQTFYPLDMDSSGWEVAGTGQLPKPKIKVNSREMTLRAALNTYDDMLGAIVRRKRTYSKYLDGQPLADSAAELPVDIYVIERKTSQNKKYIEFELSAYMDYEGIKIPRRMVLRETCTHIYRYWDGAQFVYDRASCPYTGGSYWDVNGDVEGSPEDDVCGRRISDCTLRFGENNDLPTRAFPGVGRTRG
jgi:lambda family phage minor tail protein L